MAQFTLDGFCFFFSPRWPRRSCVSEHCEPSVFLVIPLPGGV